MKIGKIVFTLTALLLLWSCVEDLAVTPQDDQTFKLQLKNSDSLRTLYSTYNSYKMKINLDHNYLEFDSINVTGTIIDSTKQEILKIKFRNDGLNGDFLANNNIWSQDFAPTVSMVKADSLIILAQIFQSGEVRKVRQAKKIKIAQGFTPQITSLVGLDSNAVWASGFDKKTITIKALDRDNEPSYVDPLIAKIQIFDSKNDEKLNYIQKMYDFQKKEFLFELDASLAAGLKTDSYSLRATVTDSRNMISEIKEVKKFTIENGAPDVFKQDASLTILPPDSLELYFKFKVSDKQGVKDLLEPKLTLYRNFAKTDSLPLTLKNDSLDIYSIRHRLFNNQNKFYYRLTAKDLVDNISTLVDSLTVPTVNGKFYKDKK